MDKIECFCWNILFFFLEISKMHFFSLRCRCSTSTTTAFYLASLSFLRLRLRDTRFNLQFSENFFFQEKWTRYPIFFTSSSPPPPLALLLKKPCLSLGFLCKGSVTSLLWEYTYFHVYILCMYTRYTYKRILKDTLGWILAEGSLVLLFCSVASFVEV